MDTVAVTLDELRARYDGIFAAWEAAGRNVYLVGGCIRDVLMGSDAIGDTDMTTDAPPDETVQILESMGWPVYPIGARFGTILTRVDGESIEITTFRIDERYELGNRKPEVTFGTSLEHDLSRRDLSINAMALDRLGVLHDPFDGRGAIRDRKLEVPGGGLRNTISILRDDPLRLLRIARFAARFADRGFCPTDDTTAAAKETAGGLEHISHERWKMELDKTFDVPAAMEGLRWLSEVGALDVLFPRLVDTKATGAGASSRADEAFEAMTEVSRRRITWWAALFLAAAWIDSVASLPDFRTLHVRRPDAEYCAQVAGRLARRFRFSKEERSQVSQLCGVTLSAADLCVEWDRTRRRRFLADWGDLYGDALDLIQTWSGVEAPVFERLRTQMNKAYAEENVHVQLPQGFGWVVLRELRLPRGPVIAQTIDRVRQAVIDGDVPNGADASVYIAFLRELGVSEQG